MVWNCTSWLHLCRLWYEIAPVYCSELCERALSRSVAIFFLSVLAFKAAVFERDGTFFELLSSKEALRLGRCIKRAWFLRSLETDTNIYILLSNKRLQMLFDSYVTTDNAITFFFLPQLPDFQATYLRFIIKSAFDHFVSVYRVMAEGTPENT